MSDYGGVRVEDGGGGVRALVLDRPPVNALGADLVEGLARAAHALAQDSSVRCLVVRSAGRHFCGGADLKERSGMDLDAVRAFVKKLGATFTSIASLPFPTIAAIRGAAVGGGCELALACDLRVLAQDATIGLRETALAILPGAGGTQRLPRLIGPGKAKRWIFTARAHDAAEALADGVADRVVPASELDQQAMLWAECIAAQGPIAIRLAKQAIDEGLALSMEEALALEWRCYERTLNTRDRDEGLRAFAEKRPPRFEGLVMLAPLHIGPVVVDPPLVLAPMAGITDRQFRLILRRLGGVGLVTMEFISSEALTRGNKRTRKLMEYSEEERPISIQIYGSNPQRMAEAARIVEAIGADICDINMGCPANKILKGCAGCALMGDLDLARRIVGAVRAAIRIPLTVKFRSGIREDSLGHIELGRICESEGVDAVALHPRTAKQMFTGLSDWAHIARLKEVLAIPVVGNGDVASAADALRMRGETGCDAVMIGRASMKNPWIYRQTSALLAGAVPVEPSATQRRALILEHFQLLREQEDPEFAMHKLRTFTGWYTHGLPEGRDLRKRIQSLASMDEFLAAFHQAPAEVCSPVS